MENVVFMISNGGTGNGGTADVVGGLRSTNNYFKTKGSTEMVATISPLSELQPITSALIVDAQTQPGWGAQPVVEVRGDLAGAASGFTLNAASVTLRGFIVNRFKNEGVTTTAGDSITIQGNWIGPDATGASKAGNGTVGIYFNSLAGGLTIGSTDANLRNVISGNAGTDGIAIRGGTGHVIKGNYIGTDPSGTSAVGNGRYGIQLYSATTGVTIGGAEAGAGNVIAGNGDAGIYISGIKNTVQGNIIGANLTASAVLANRSGIVLGAGAASNAIGGVNSGESNVITGSSTGPGVSVVGGANNPIRRNHIYSNAGLGIDLAGDGVTKNDGVQTTSQPNLLTDYPIFISAGASTTKVGPATLKIAGYVGSNPGQSAFALNSVDVFLSDGDSTGFGEGSTYLGSTTTDANGNFADTLTLPTGVTIGSSKISATATDASGNTSEFGPALTPSASTFSISGTIFDDINYGGGAGRAKASATGWLAASNGTSRATVELYDSTGSIRATTSAAADGTYSFTGLSADTYRVRLVTGSTPSGRTGWNSGLAPVLTFRTDVANGAVAAVTDRVGGESPLLAEAPANSGSQLLSALTTSSAAPQAVSTVVVSSTVVGVDFGVNFDTVTNAANTGAGTLRQVITNANALTGDSTLSVSGRTTAVEHAVFMLSNGTSSSGLRSAFNAFTTAGGATNVATITPTSAMTTVTATLVMDAQTQPGWVDRPIIELRGSSAGSSSGLTVNASNTVLRGFVVNRFAYEGITSTAGDSITIQGNWSGLDATGTTGAGNGYSGVWMNSTGNGHVIGGTTAAQRNVLSGNTTYEGVAIGGGSGHTISGNYIGTDAGGATAIRNGGQGIKLYSPVSSSTIGGTSTGAGNVIAGSGGNGILLYGPSTITIQGNLIGTNAAGTGALANTGRGILVSGAGTTIIGGTTTTARNIISGNTNEGVYVETATSTGTVIQGNYIGLDRAGTTALGNGGLAGVYVLNGATGVTIGGSTSGAGNVISGNTGRGVLIGSGANTMRGNIIGLNAAGTSALKNNEVGLVIDAGIQTIGGTTTADRNVISGNLYEGILIDSTTSSGTIIQGNFIGTDLTGTTPIGNGRNGGVWLRGTTAGVKLGGTIAGTGNVITGGAAGVAISSTGNGNSVQGNSIYGNTALGIDLGVNGVTANDGVVTAGQPNQYTDSPVITTAASDGSTLTLAGYVGSAAGQAGFANNRVEFFVSDGDSTGFGEGRTYLGFLTTGSTNGNFSGTISIPTGVSIVANTSKLTATATDIANNTSEFGANVTVASNLSISGTVFDDVNYGGGAGRAKASATGWLAASNGISRATVELYSSTGTRLASTTAAADGTYSFSMLTEASYQVRLVVGTTPSGRAGWTSALSPVLTYRVDASTGTAIAVTDRVGGESPSLIDAAANSGTQALSALTSATAVPQAIAPVTLSSGSVSLVDFGVNFDAVTTTRNSGAGSLRQAITNANALTGDATLAVSGRTAAVEHAIFMVSNGTTGSGGALNLTGGLRTANNYFTTTSVSANAATITPTSAIPTVTSALVIDAQTQPGWTLNPVIEIRGSSAPAGASGLTVNASNSIVRGFIVNRFPAEGILSTTGNNITVQGCWVGIDATGTVRAGDGNGGVYFSGTGSNGVVGGTTAAYRNVLSGSTTYEGVAFEGGSGHLVQGNYIGTDYTGNVAIPNGQYGVAFYAGVSTSTIGGSAAGAGNLISGNTVAGVAMQTNTGTVVQGNKIGTNAAGTGALKNLRGFWVSGGTNITIGGTSAGQGNLISGNGTVGSTVDDQSGIYVVGSSNLTIAGNTIGLGSDGTSLANVRNGIYITASTTGPSTVTVGGATSASRNIISGNTSSGVSIANNSTGSVSVQNNWIGLGTDGTTARGNGSDGVVCNIATVNNCTITNNVIAASGRYGISLATGTGHVVKANYIGTDSTGTVARPNSSGGVYVVGSGVTATIGSATASDRNVISGNGGWGVRVETAGAVTIQGNYIGTAANGTSALGNSGPGVTLVSTSGSSVGGTVTGAGNVIANNTGVGVSVGPSSGSGNAILGNSMYANSSTGIDLGTSGVRTNDGAKTTGAPNLYMDSPVFTSASLTGSNLTVAGYVGSAANQAAFANSRVEVFVSDGDSSGYGEGKIYIGTLTTGTTNGNFSGSLTVPTGVSATSITGTATDSSNNTSEFGANVNVTYVLPVTSGLVVSLDANRMSTMYQNSTGTTAVTTTGQSVCRWADQSGVANHATQATTSQCPKYGSDSLGGFLEFTANGWVTTSPRLSPDASVFVVAESSTDPWNNYGWLASARGANGFIIHPWVGNQLVGWFVVNSSAAYTSTSSQNVPTLRNTNLYEMTISGTGTVTGVSGMNGAATSYSVTGVNRVAGNVNVALGADDGLPGRLGSGKFREVIIYNRALTSAELLQMDNYLKAKWSIGVTPTSVAGAQFAGLWGLSSPVAVSEFAKTFTTIVKGIDGVASKGPEVALRNPAPLTPVPSVIRPFVPYVKVAKTIVKVVKAPAHYAHLNRSKAACVTNCHSGAVIRKPEKASVR